MRARFAVALVSLCLLAASSGCYFPEPSPPPPAYDYEVTVGQIRAEFEANELAAKKKYEGCKIAVSGYIQSIDTQPITGFPVIYLEDSPDESIPA